VLRRALGDHISEAFLAEKRAEWSEYQAQVHQWEIDKYMEVF
jgi:glutamine synthetase